MYLIALCPGVRALSQPRALPASQEPEVREYEVRPAFLVTLSCTREKAGSPCMPIGPISLRFSAAVARAALQDISLTLNDTVFPAELKGGGGGEYVTRLQFPGPFPAKTTLRLSVPRNLQDDAGRTLENAARFP